MSLPQLTNLYIIGPPTFCLLLPPITAPPYTLYSSHNNPLGKFLIPWGFSTCSYFCQTMPPDNLMAHTFSSYLEISAAQKSLCHGSAHKYSLSLFISVLLHFLSQHLLSTHIDILFISPPPTGIEYYASSHWKRNSLELYLVHCCIQGVQNKVQHIADAQ